MKSTGEKGGSGPGVSAGRVAGLDYVVLALLVSFAGAWLAVRVGAPEPLAAWVGALGAWAIQSVAFVGLVRALDAGRTATPVWVAGIAARIAGLAAAFAASRLMPGMETLALAYGAAILLLLLIEAGWLAIRRRPELKPMEADGASEREEARPDDSGSA